MKLFLLVLTTLLFARENPFKPVITNENNNLIKKEYFSQKTIQLPDDARIIKTITFKYQTLTGAIKEISYPIDKAIDWHNPIIIKTKKTIIPPKKIKVGFLNFYIKKHKVLIQTQNKLLRDFMLIKPFRYVLDFKANKDFLTFSKTTNSFIKKIVLGNHNGFYRVVLYLDGTYKTNIKKTNEGYLIEFK